MFCYPCCAVRWNLLWLLLPCLSSSRTTVAVLLSILQPYIARCVYSCLLALVAVNINNVPWFYIPCCFVFKQISRALSLNARFSLCSVTDSASAYCIESSLLSTMAPFVSVCSSMYPLMIAGAALMPASLWYDLRLMIFKLQCGSMQIKNSRVSEMVKNQTC